MKKKISLMFLSILLVGMLSFVLAQEGEELDIPEAKKVGVFASMGDRIRLAFTFNNEKRVEVALQIAEKRLAHAEAMAETNPEAAEVAMQKYEEYLKRAEVAAEDIENANNNDENKSLNEMSRLIRVQNRIEMHKEIAESIQLRALERFQRNNVSEEKISKFEELYANGLRRLNTSEKKIVQARERVSSRYMNLSNSTQEKTRERIRESEDQEGLTKYRQEKVVRDAIRLERYTAVKDREIERVRQQLMSGNLSEEQRNAFQMHINNSLERIENYEGVIAKRTNLTQKDLVEVAVNTEIGAKFGSQKKSVEAQ